MPSSTMWISVVQTTAIQIAGLVLFQHFQGTMLDHFTNDPAFSDLLSAFANKSSHFNATHHSIANTTSGPISLPTGSHSLAKEGDNYGFSFTISDAANATAANQTFSALRDNPVSFYREILPMEIISFLVLSIFQYCWLIGLERAFPARPRRTNVLVDEKVGVDDPREEEIVKTWIARGRVRRVSLSWCNTWLKWVLNLTIGRLGLTALSCILRKSLHLVEITEESQDDIIKEVALQYVFSLVSIDAIVELLAFIVIPAYKQIVFLAGADLVFHIFVATVVSVVSSWAIRTDLVQGTLRNMTGVIMRAREYAREHRELLLSRDEL